MSGTELTDEEIREAADKVRQPGMSMPELASAVGVSTYRLQQVLGVPLFDKELLNPKNGGHLLTEL